VGVDGTDQQKATSAIDELTNGVTVHLALGPEHAAIGVVASKFPIGSEGNRADAVGLSIGGAGLAIGCARHTDQEGALATAVDSGGVGAEVRPHCNAVENLELPASFPDAYE
jgi:hypothetical protein